MARKVLGYIELVWTCDSCGTRNPGAIKSCTSCGAPQPINVQFERVDPETFNFIKDEALIRMAKSGPDKHCPYCGTRNLADAKTCVNCGGDLTVGATSRPTGILNAEAPTPVPEPVVPGNSTTTPTGRNPISKGVIVIAVIVLLALCIFGAMYFMRMNQTDQLDATVSRTFWQRQVALEAYQVVQASDWQANIPFNVQAYDCQLRYRYNSDNPTQNSEEVCGTPYTIDTGTGVGEVVQDCYYKVYENYCSYDTMQWVVVNTLAESGYGTNAFWPTTNLGTDQRLGNASERYTITFLANSDSYEYTTTDYNLYQLAQPGSDWEIEVNGFGNVTSANPK